MWRPHPHVETGSALIDGMHIFTVQASTGALVKTDSVPSKPGRTVQIQTPAFVTRKSMYVTAGIVLSTTDAGLDTSITSLTLSVNGSSKSVMVTAGKFFDSTTLSEGKNVIKVITPNGEDSVCD